MTFTGPQGALTYCLGLRAAAADRVRVDRPGRYLCRWRDGREFEAVVYRDSPWLRADHPTGLQSYQVEHAPWEWVRRIDEVTP